VPLTTIDNLLAKLGYLQLSAGSPSGDARSSALSRFQGENGLARSGERSIAVMGQLLHASTP